MNKLLPILLVVVLSGCAGEVKSPLENCADKQYILSNYYARAVELSKDERYFCFSSEFRKKHGEDHDLYYYYYKGKYKDNSNNSDPRYDKETQQCIDKTMESNKKIAFPDDLKQKLIIEVYANLYKECELEQRNYPKTFDAKWK